MDFDKMMKECMKPHALMHMLTGVGLGMVVLALVPDLFMNALVIGLLIVVVGFVGDFMVQKKG